MSTRTRILTFVTLVAAVLVGRSAAHGQTTWYVDDDALHDPGPGDPTVSDPLEDGSADHPFDAIQEGINAALDGDTVLVADGSYRGPGNRSVELDGKAITVRSAHGPEGCIIDCEGSPQNRRRFCRFYEGETADTVLRGFTITNGFINDNGGALRFDYSNPTIADCKIIGHHGEDGGAAYIYHSSPSFISCTIADNAASGRGGGVFALGGNADLINCRILQNTATGDGGGAVAFCGITFINCAIAGNNSGGNGGGAYCAGINSLHLVNCTVAGNIASGIGGGLCNGLYAETTVANCIVWSNGASEGAQIALHNSDTALVISHSDVQDGQDAVYVGADATLVWGEGNIDADPCFVHLIGQNVHVGARSPCIDAGDNDSVPTDSLDLDEDGDLTEPIPWDVDGEARFFDDPLVDDTGSPPGSAPFVDMGADEYQPDCDGNGILDSIDLANCGPEELWCQDCNTNGVPDACDLAESTSSDCNTNGVPDECDVREGTSEDCNDNEVPDECEPDCNETGQPDDCDIADGTSEDCNGNGVPDECDLADETSEDCNQNSVPDECDIEGGISQDTNADGIPDECQDCNGNGVPDPIDIADGSSLDCNGNGAPDECDLLDGTSEDCNANGIPDECDISGWFHGESGQMSPIGGGSPQTFTLPAPPEALSDVTLGIEAFGDFGESTEMIDVYITDAWVAAAFGGAAGHDCPSTADRVDRVVAMGEYNSLVAGGDAVFTIVASATVDPNECDEPSYVAITIDYEVDPRDCNGNGIPDECDLADGASADCNDNELPDECELDVYQRVSPQLAPIGDGCPQSLTVAAAPGALGDVQLTFEAVADLSASYEHIDVDINGVFVGGVFVVVGSDCPAMPDLDRLVVPMADWNAAATAGGVLITMTASVNVDPYACDPMSYVRVVVEYEAVGGNDCNDNSVPDDCDLADGTSVDTNADGIPDECQDCNGNAVPDPVDITDGTSADCNENGVPDECDLLDGTSGDCNENLIPDECDIAGGTSEDCNGNGIPDECDVADGGSDDCNGNGVPDECEPDCNGNGIADECDILNGTSPDCNENGVPDECDLADGDSADCNENDVPDECDIVAGTSNDCNGNGIPDECDISPLFRATSPRLSPIGYGSPQSFTLLAPPEALSDVTLGFEAIADLGDEDERISVRINDVQVTYVFGGPAGHDCPATPDTLERVVPMADYNALVAGGDAVIAMVTNSNVDPNACEPGSYVRVSVEYERPTGDCNFNGLPDDCDIADGTSLDCNGNSVPDECDLDGGASEDCNENGVPDECDIADGTSADTNADGIPDECQDCNGNGVPDPVDLANGTSEDCNENSRPDECDIAEGTSLDCNENGVPDECDLADGTSADCNGNGIPDECDTADGTSEDCNANGVPDECEVWGIHSVTSPQLSPIGDGSPQTFTVTAPPLALSDVGLCFEAVADLGAYDERVAVYINGVWVANLFGASAGHDCPDMPDTAERIVPAGDYNAIVAGGDADITMVATESVDPYECDPYSYIVVSVEYEGNIGDCNTNDVPDECDIADGTSSDVNGNGVPDECECLGDLDGDSEIDLTDLAQLLANYGTTGGASYEDGDIDADGDVDLSDLAALLSVYGEACP